MHGSWRRATATARAWLPTISAGATPFAPVASLLGFAVAARPVRGPHRRWWLLAWSAFLLPVLVRLFTPASFGEVLIFAGQVALGVGASLVVRAGRRGAARALLVALALMAGLAVADRWASATTWHPLTANAVERSGLTARGIEQRLEGAGDLPLASRAWSVPEGTEVVDVSLSARHVIADRRSGEQPPVQLHLRAIAPTPDGNWRAQRSFDLTGDWRQFTWRLSLPPGVRYLQLRPLLAEGAVAETAPVEVRTVEPDSALRALPTRTRQELWFTHPNLFAHTAALAGALVLVSAGSWWLRGVGVSLAYVCVLYAASRAAALALGAALVVYVAGRALELVRGPPARGGRRPLGGARSVAVGLAVGAASLAGVWVVAGLREEVAAVSRWEIWREAVAAMLAHPWRGSGAGYGSAWQLAAGAEPVTHAHNIVLHAGAAFGLFAAAAVAWLLLAMAFIAWRRNGFAGIAFVACLYATQLFDATLFSAHVLLLAILGVNVARPGAAARQHPSSRRPHLGGPAR